jgi:hypothetical protein
VSPYTIVYRKNSLYIAVTSKCQKSPKVKTTINFLRKCICIIMKIIGHRYYSNNPLVAGWRNNEYATARKNRQHGQNTS